MLLQQAQQPQSEFFFQLASIVLPLLVIAFQALAPRISQWRRERAVDQEAEHKASQEMRRINDMQSAGWEKLYLIQEDMINRLQKENMELKIEVSRLLRLPPEEE